jgi:hypothetical protein
MWRKRLSNARKKATVLLQRQEEAAYAEKPSCHRWRDSASHLHGTGSRPRPRLRFIQAEQDRAT